MPDRRVPILAQSIGGGITAVRALGLRGLDPRWFFMLTPGELRRFAPGTTMVDLTQLPTRNHQAGKRLREAAAGAGMVLVTSQHLRELPPYVAGTG